MPARPRPLRPAFPRPAVSAHVSCMHFDPAMIAGNFEQVVQPRCRFWTIVGDGAKGSGAHDVELSGRIPIANEIGACFMDVPVQTEPQRGCPGQCWQRLSLDYSTW
jgi:hypothetical protein